MRARPVPLAASLVGRAISIGLGALAAMLAITAAVADDGDVLIGGIESDDDSAGACEDDDRPATLTAPVVPVDAHDRTRHLGDVYVGLFRPSGRYPWPGNLRKLRLRAADARIVDGNGRPVFDPVTGRFAEDAQDLWSSTPHGANVTAGGAAGRIPVARRVYTWLGAHPALTDSANAITSANDSLTETSLGLAPDGSVTRAAVIDFINGVDVADADGDGETTDARQRMGAPHSRPVVVSYGPGNDNALVFVGTGDGFLHAFDAADGSERWAFLPREFLGRQAKRVAGGPVRTRVYGVDGSLRVQTIADDNGVIEAQRGEKVYLFFGLRRGGDAYYALDVTDPDSPRVLWRRDGSDLPGSAQSWSALTPARIAIADRAQNEHELVLVAGGGYDRSLDEGTPGAGAKGNSIYVLDTLTGELLWRGAPSGGTRNFASMTYAIPADVEPIDLDGDGFTDRMYTADLAGQIWRFDIANGSPAASLVAGGVIARLGTAGRGETVEPDDRRFFHAPDIAVVRTRRDAFVHIGIGSGDRARPNTARVRDAFFALRDHAAFTARDQAAYAAFAPILPFDLTDVTSAPDAAVPRGSPGWRLRLGEGGAAGEKVLAEARTFDGRVYFSTFRPRTDDAGCESVTGAVREYVIDVIDGAPAVNLDASVDDDRDRDNGGSVDARAELELSDRYREFSGQPPPEPAFYFPGSGDGRDASDAPSSPGCLAAGGCPGAIRCLGLACFADGEPRLPTRTFWRQDDID